MNGHQVTTHGISRGQPQLGAEDDRQTRAWLAHLELVDQYAGHLQHDVALYDHLLSAGLRLVDGRPGRELPPCVHYCDDCRYIRTVRYCK